VSVTRDMAQELLMQLRTLAENEVLVGVPDINAAREDDGEKKPASNAQLAYIHDNGAPEQNIPARPFMVPGLQSRMAAIEGAMRNAGRLTLTLDKAPGSMSQASTRAIQSLHRVGLIAQAAIRNKINEGIPPPLSPLTIAMRHHQRGTKSMRKGEVEYFKLLGQGKTPAEAQTSSGIKALINTGQLRNSITYVIRKRGARRR